MNDARVIPRSRAALGDLTKAQVDDTPPRCLHRSLSVEVGFGSDDGPRAERGKSEGPQLCCNSPLLNIVSVELVDASHPWPDCISQRP